MIEFSKIFWFRLKFLPPDKIIEIMIAKSDNIFYNMVCCFFGWKYIQ